MCCTPAIKIGWEYLCWIDLMLTKLREVVIFKISLTEIHFLQKNDVSETTHNVQKHKKRSNDPTTDFCGPNKALLGPCRAPAGPINGPYRALYRALIRP